MSDETLSTVTQNNAADEIAQMLKDAAHAVFAPAPLPSQVGGYRILDVLGRGGMGVVYRAEQPSPRREVALKVIGVSFVNDQLLRRFELEAQTLGRLKHPGIAQVYEADVHHTDHGAQPFFAMELVEGVPLDEYAQKHQLDTTAKLQLLIKLCDAMQYAHQQQVIHRDLKPANVLVTADGQPKILDFGVARATDSDVKTTTMHTDVGQLIGTLPYMSPEQAAGDRNEIDTRSDVYALGVIAYELLAGKLPHDLRGLATLEAARRIREDEPSRLSSLDRALRGDLETIVQKALEKDKTRRYATANALAADVKRFLNYEPITARPPSTWYHLKTFARRNKAVVVGTMFTIVALSVGIIVSSALYARANQRARILQLLLATAAEGSPTLDVYGSRNNYLDVEHVPLEEAIALTRGLPAERSFLLSSTQGPDAGDFRTQVV
jgi:non-specific serine/threonine protein kinase/serine/threonine-protein kinase